MAHGFKECTLCNPLTGTPTLCPSCLHNRLVIEKLQAALQATLDSYTELVNCGDCGNWDCETEQHVIQARSLLTPSDQFDLLERIQHQEKTDD